MPTGYTACVVDKNVSFEEFVWGCARAMGAAISMRDDAMDAQIPEEFSANPFYLEKLQEAKKNLADLDAMSQEEQLAMARQNMEEEVAELKKYRLKILRDDKRLNKMLRKVEAWTPPTADHEDFKKFMISQLKHSMTHGTDYPDYRLTDLAIKTAEERLSEGRKSYVKDVERFRDEYEQEVVRTQKRNAWLKNLRESVPQPVTQTA